MTSREVPTAAEFLRGCFDAAIAAVLPAPAIARALRETTPPVTAPAVIAIGKAAHGMALGLERWLDHHGHPAHAGLIVAAEDSPSPGPQYRVIVGDHPIPEVRSLRAADRLGTFISALPPAAPVHIALSGGASALIGAPGTGLSLDGFHAAFDLLFRAGLPISAMNAVRKRLTRWSAGRLALALDGHPIQLWAISDVRGDRLEDIGSGPCSGDPWSTDEVIALLDQAALLDRFSADVRAALEVETPKPDDPRLTAVQSRVIATNADALRAAARHAESMGRRAVVATTALEGEARSTGLAIATALASGPNDGAVHCWGGETTVSLVGESGVGGRSQELALAASGLLRPGITLLAAGSDGRDGPTDAAGAIVTSQTWTTARALGLDPQAALDRHDSYPLLDRTGALLRTGPTGTNVMDLVLAVTDVE